MADKTIDIEVRTKADKSEIVDLSEAIKVVGKDAEEASEKIEGMSDSTNSISSESLNEVSDSASDAGSSLEDGASGAERMGDAVSDIDTSSVESVSDSASGADDSLSSASDSGESLSISISSIDPSVLEQLAMLAGQAGDEMERLKDNTDGASESMSMVDAVASASLSESITSAFMSGADAAGNYSDTMVRLGYAMTGTSMTAKEAEQKFGGLITSMANETGRGAGAVRAHLVNMGNVGITSEQVLSDSFNGISKAAFQMGTDMDTMEQKFQRIVLSGMVGSRQLTQFGLSTQDIANAMGVSVDEVTESFKALDNEQRATILSTALNMKYGQDVTNNYKNSYEHLMDTLVRAKDYFIRVAGEALLPVLIPAIQTAADFINLLANTFKSLPSPIQGAIGVIAGLIAGFTAIGLATSSVIKIVGAAFSPFLKLFNLLTGQNIRSVVEFARIMGNLGKAVLEAGVNALRAAGMWVVQKAQLIASSIASGIATVKNWLLAISEWAVASPILIVIAVIIALIAVLGYLYFNNEQVRQAIDGLGQSLMNIAGIIYNTIINAFNYFTSFGQQLLESVGITGGGIINTIVGVLAFVATLPLRIGVILINTIAKILGFGNNFVQNMVSSASRGVSGFISWISSLPSRFAQELNNMINYALNFASRLPSILYNAGMASVQNFLNALGIHSPGTMQRKLLAEMEDTGERIPQASSNLIKNVSNVGSSVVDAFGNPSFNTNFANQGIIAGVSNGEGQTINITLNVGTVDKKERVDEIINAVNDYFRWNNTTAGRTV